MLDIIKLRLQSLGYEVVPNDDFTLRFVIDKVENHIKHFCNISEIPDCLNCVLVDMVCGEFLKSKKSMGQLTSIQIEQAVKRIEDGDTTVDFQTGTDTETRFYTYLDKLINGHNESLIRHRKIVW